MISGRGTVRVCVNGHRYVKSSDCPVCPVCETNRKPAADFMKVLGAPARRALENAGIITLEKLSGYTGKDILSLHGIGPSAIPKLQQELKKNGLSFKEQPDVAKRKLTKKR